MSGKDAIIEKIRSDAREIAVSTSEEASRRGMEIIRQAQENAKLYHEKHMEESAAERDEILQRKTTVANLEVKKMLLAAKQELISKSFADAAALIRADKRYPDMLEGMLKNANDGDVVTFSERDKDLVSSGWFETAAQKIGKKITMNTVFGSFLGGIVLSSGGSDKNLTLEVELAGVRDGYEPEIAAMLFGE